MEAFSAFLNDFWGTIKANFAVVIALVSAMVTGMIALRTQGRQALSTDKKTDVDVGRLEFERERATDERFDRLVAHLERQLETMDKKLDRANKTIDDQSMELGWLKRKIITMDAHITRLGEMIVTMGGTPPDRPADPPHD